MLKFLTIFFTFFFGFEGFAQSTTDKLIDFSKSYGSVRYFYPDTTLSRFDWDQFLIENVYQIISNEKYNFLPVIQEIAPLSFFSNNIQQIDSIDVNNLENYFYWQHLGDFKNSDRTASDIINAFCYSPINVENTIKLYNVESEYVNLEIKFKCFNETQDILEIGLSANNPNITIFETICSSNWQSIILDSIPISQNFDLTQIKLSVFNQKNDSILVDFIKIRNYNDSLIYSVDFDFNTYSPLGNWDRIFKDRLANLGFDSIQNINFLQLQPTKGFAFYTQKDLSKYIRLTLSDTTLYLPRFIDKNSLKFQEIKSVSKLIDVDKNLYQKSIFISDFVHLHTLLTNTYTYKHIVDKIDLEELFNKCIYEISTNKLYSLEYHKMNLIYYLSAYKDPHLIVYHDSLNASPFFLKFINNKEIVVYDANIQSEDSLKIVGKKVKKVNGIPSKKFIKSKIFELDKKNEALNNRLVYQLFNTAIDNYVYQLKIGNKNYSLKEYNLLPYKYLYSIQSDFLISDTSFTFFNGKAGFLSYNRFTKYNPDKEHVINVCSSDYVLIDLRKGSIGTHLISIINHNFLKYELIDSKDKLYYFENPYSYPPSNYKVVYFNSVIRNLPYYHKINPKQKVFVLTDYGTLSFNERQILPLYENNKVKLIGTKTAGSSGFISNISLPSQFKIQYTVGYHDYSDGTPYQNNGMKPHYPVKQKFQKNPTLKNDAAFQKALKVIKKEIRKDERKN
jgi:hypothetical protein